jgi:hypothetical protein
MSAAKCRAGTSWRDHIKVHPAADLFPMMSDDELKALGEDIKENGYMNSPIVLKNPHAFTVSSSRSRLSGVLTRILRIKPGVRGWVSWHWRPPRGPGPADAAPIGGPGPPFSRIERAALPPVTAGMPRSPNRRKS